MMSGARGCYDCGGCAWCFRVVRVARFQLITVVGDEDILYLPFILSTSPSFLCVLSGADVNHWNVQVPVHGRSIRTRRQRVKATPLTF